jgi:hypothetical protein
MTTQIETLDQKFHTLTDKYKLVKTADLIAKVEAQGFTLTKFVANKVKNKEKQGFQKHRAIFNSPLLKSTPDGTPQLLLTNSHDGTSSVILQLGFFRLVCANGLVFGTNICAPIKLRHSGNDIDEKLTIAINFIVAQADKINGAIERMKAVQLSDAQIKEFQRDALKLRTDAHVESFHMSINRNEDNSADVFTVMNVIQENLIRGGAKVLVEKDGKRSNRTLRGINSIQTQTALNVALWDMAEAKVA